MKAFHLAAAAALTTALTIGLTACGSQAAGQPAGPPAAGTATVLPARTVTPSWQVAGTATARPSSPAPTLTGPAMLTAADNGMVVRLRVGHVLACGMSIGYADPREPQSAMPRAPLSEVVTFLDR